jgi:hypothetical protein
MACTECTKAYELIELPVGSSKDAVRSARKEWSKNLHPDIWQNRPGWKGAGNQLSNINVAIDHLLQCDRAGSSPYASSSAKPKSVNEAEVAQTGTQHAMKTRTKGWIMFAGFCVVFVLYLTTTLLSPGQADAPNQEPTSFTRDPSGIPQLDASESSPTQAAPVSEDPATVEKEVEQPKATSVASSPTPETPAAPEALASTTSQSAVPDESQLRVETFEKYCGVDAREWNLSCQKWHNEVSVSPRPAYVPVALKVTDHAVVPDLAATIRNQYGFAQKTAPVGYAAMQKPEAQPSSRATTLIPGNGPTMYVTNVWYWGERIMFTMPNGSHRSLGLEQVNFRSTIQANRQIGVGFHTPPGYPGN